MKASKKSFWAGTFTAVRGVAGLGAATLLAAILGCVCFPTPSRAQTPDADAAGATVLTRGPVHEAFAGVVAFNPEPGIVVTKAPPEAIEELPPAERPEGDNVTWIPGYWAWDDERNDYLWVSGTWRALPPGRAWIAGYWGKTPQGYQWTSGYWAEATAQNTTYLPAPPASVEAGPNVAAPSAEYDWAPGGWIWYQDRYAWSPGYWVPGRADWDWCPGHYVWTPRGFIYVGGFWDYPVERRGVLFAPVYFGSGIRGRHGSRYSPTIVIGLGVFSDDLFVRPRYSHYYFGDYYDPGYVQTGFYASFSFQSGHRGYDPIFSHERWEHRSDHEWAQHAEGSYNNRRDHADLRPPRTWAAEQKRDSGPAAARQNHPPLAMPLDQLARHNDGPMKFQPVAKSEQQQLARRGRDVQKSRTERQTLEAQAANPARQINGATAQPVAVRLPRSSIISKPLGRSDQVPPRARPTPENDNHLQQKSEVPARQPGIRDNSRPVLEPGVATPHPRPVESSPNPHPNLAPGEIKPAAPVHQTEVKRNDPQPAAQPAAPEIKPAPKQNEAPPPERHFQPPVRQTPDQNDKGAARFMRNDRPPAGHGDRPAPVNPAPPPARENPPAQDGGQPAAPDRNGGKKDR